MRPPLPRILPLHDRMPWNAGPQSLPVGFAPGPDTARTVFPLAGGAVSGNPQSPLTFPKPTWEAEAHRYAYCSNLILPYTQNSAMVLSSPVTYRNFLALRNLSAAQTVAIQFGSAATANSAIQLPPSSFILFDTVVPQDDMYLIGVAGAGDLSCVVSTIALPPLPPA